MAEGLLEVLRRAGDVLVFDLEPEEKVSFVLDFTEVGGGVVTSIFFLACSIRSNLSRRNLGIGFLGFCASPSTKSISHAVLS